MKAQVFEGPPSEELLIAQLDLLKYENAFLRNSINSLRDQIDKLEESEAEYIEKIKMQQYHIDRLTASCLKS
jgi:hypothetical protein